MSLYGKQWKIDGVIAGPILAERENGRYRILFECEHASLEQIESIRWEQPAIQRLPACPDCETGLPEGYGFTLENIEYHYAVKAFCVYVKTARQYLGDVTGYQTRLDALNAENTTRQNTIQELQSREKELAGAYAEGVESHG